MRNVLRFAGLISAVLAIVFGAAGYMLMRQRLPDSLYYAARMFFFEFDAKGLVANSEKGYPLPLEIARWLAAFAVLHTVILAAWKTMIDHLKRWMLDIRKGHYVIIGMNHHAKELAGDLLASKHRVVVIHEGAADDPLCLLLEAKGAVVVHGDPTEKDVLAEARIHKSRHCVVFSFDDAENVEITLAVLDALKRKGIRTSSLTLHVQLLERQLGDLYEHVQDSPIKDKVEMRIFNIYENAAKQLFWKMPLYKPQHAGADAIRKPHLLIVGFGGTGEHALLQAIKIAHYPGSEKLKVTVVDKYAHQRESWFRMRYPDLDDVCDIAFEETDIESLVFKDNFLARNRDFSHCVIALEDRKHLLSSIQIVRSYNGIPVAVKMTKDRRLANWLEANSGSYSHVVHFGGIEETSTADIILGERLDAMARAIHSSYMEKSGSGETWEQLSLFKKDSNRAQADHIQAKLQAMDFVLVKSRDDIPHGYTEVTEPQFRDASSRLLETLAVVEHERWCTFYRLHGWKPCPPDEGKDDERKLNPCLVDWSGLDAVSEARTKKNNKPIDYKELDRDTVRDLLHTAKKAGYYIVKRA